MTTSLITGNFDSESVLKELLFLQSSMPSFVAMKSNSNPNDHWIFDTGSHLGHTTAGMTSSASRAYSHGCMLTPLALPADCPPSILNTHFRRGPRYYKERL
jgi:hypothetical protein